MSGLAASLLPNGFPGDHQPPVSPRHGLTRSLAQERVRNRRDTFDGSGTPFVPTGIPRLEREAIRQIAPQ